MIGDSASWDVTPMKPLATSTTPSRVIARSDTRFGGSRMGRLRRVRPPERHHDVGLVAVGASSDEVEVACGRVAFRSRREPPGLAGEIDSAQRVEIRAQFVGERAIAVREDRVTEGDDAVGDEVWTSGRRSVHAFDSEP